MPTLFDEAETEGAEPRGSHDVATSGRLARFTLLERIGAGGMGELHAAYDPRLDRKIALKLVRNNGGGSQGSARLLREAQALAKLSHPNVVTVYEVGVAPERGVYIAMEYVRGMTLSARLATDAAEATSERVRIHRLLRLFREAGRGLEAVHAAGFAHRDFKPENVIVGEDGRVRVIDFGLARNVQTSIDGESQARTQSQLDDGTAPPLDETGSLSDADLDELTPNGELSTLTRAGALVGTPRYMAPEQWLTKRGDSRSDQFAFCVALYRAIYGAWPFDGPTRRELMDAVLAGTIPPPPRKPEISDRLQAAILRGLARDPNHRAASMGELLDTIDELLEPRSRRLTWSLLGALLLTMVFAGWTWRAAGHSPGSTFTAFQQIEREFMTERRYAEVRLEVEALDAADRQADADAVFLAFAGQRQHAHTDALARAWLDYAHRLHARGEGEIEAELAALGEAQIAGASIAQRRLALVELVRALDQSHRDDERGTALAELERLGFAGLDGPGGELWAIAMRDAVYRRDFTRALARLEQSADHPLTIGLGPVVRALGQAVVTEHELDVGDVDSGVITLAGIDLDHDERDELLLWTGDAQARVLGASPELPVVQELELDGVDARDRGFMPLRAGDTDAPAYAVTLGREHTRVFSLERLDGRVTARSVIERAGGHRWWAAADLREGPGWNGAELWVADASARRLGAYRRGNGRFVEFEPEPSFVAEGSVLNSLTVGDLDGDGGDELLVGLGAWWAYDLRVLRPVPTDEPKAAPFELLARRKLGSVDALALVPAADGNGRWIAANIGPTPPNPRVFPGPSETGEAPGMILLAWRDGELEIVDRFEIPEVWSFMTGDIDGNGNDELFANGPSGLGLWAIASDRRYAGLWLDGIKLHAIADLDGDGDDELLVSDRHATQRHEPERLTILGLGSEALQVLEHGGAVLSEPPAQLDPEGAELWHRAELLHYSALPLQAKASFEALARLVRPDVTAQVLRHAAQLADGQLPPRVVAELFERAGDPESLARAVEIHDRRHAFLAAARVAARLAEHTELPLEQREVWQRRATELRLLGAPDTTITADFGEPLDRHWRLTRPALLKRSATGLRVDSIHGPPLLERPFVWDGGALELDLELVLERMEWGAGLFIELWPVDADGELADTWITQLRFASWGGGGHYILSLRDTLQDEPGGIGGQRVLRGALPPTGQNEYSLRLGLRADRDLAWVDWESRGDGPPDTSLEGPKPLPGPAKPGRYVLRLSAGEEPWVRGTVRLERMRLLGAREDPAAERPSWREQVTLAIVNDDSAAALEQLEQLEPGTLEPRDLAWLRGLALDRAGRWSDAVAEFERALAGCEADDVIERFAYALLLWPDRLGPTLRQVCTPEQFLRATEHVTRTTLFQHKDLGDIHRTLTTQLIELERYEPPNVELAVVAMTLLTSRARGWYMQGLPEAAEADLRRVVELAEHWRTAETDPASSPERVRELRRARALAHVGYAAVLMHRNKPDEAMAALLRALEADPAPEIIADVIVARPMFGPLMQRPVWANIAAAQRGLWRIDN